MLPEETRLERTVYRWCGLAVLAGAAFGVFEVWRVAGPEGLIGLGQSALSSFLLLGKFVVFAGLHENSVLSVWGLALMVWLIDVLLAFGMASGLDGLERMPVIGPWLLRARARAHDVLRRYPGLKRMAFLGVVAYFLLPVTGTGAVTGSFVARVIGLPRVSGVLAITIASAWSTTCFALLAHFLGERGEELLRSPVLAGMGLVLLLVLGWSAWTRIAQHLRQG